MVSAFHSLPSSFKINDVSVIACILFISACSLYYLLVLWCMYFNTKTLLATSVVVCVTDVREVSCSIPDSGQKVPLT